MVNSSGHSRVPDGGQVVVELEGADLDLPKGRAIQMEEEVGVVGTRVVWNAGIVPGGDIQSRNAA